MTTETIQTKLHAMLMSVCSEQIDALAPDLAEALLNDAEGKLTAGMAFKLELRNKRLTCRACLSFNRKLAAEISEESADLDDDQVKMELD